MKRTFALLAGLAATLAVAMPAAAQEGTLKKIKDSRLDHHRPPRRLDPLLLLRRQAAARRLRHGPVREHRRRGEGRAEDAQAQDVNYQLVTSANRIPLMANGTIDLECGSTTNNLARQKQVVVHHHALRHRQPLGGEEVRRTSRRSQDLKGKTIVSTAGTTNIKQITEINAAQNLGMNIISANGHPEAFQMVETGRAVAFVMDDILLYSLAAQSRTPERLRDLDRWRCRSSPTASWCARTTRRSRRWSTTR